MGGPDSAELRQGFALSRHRKPRRASRRKSARTSLFTKNLQSHDTCVHCLLSFSRLGFGVGNELNHLYARENDGRERDLTPREKLRAAFFSWTRDLTGFYFASNERDPRFNDLYRYDARVRTLESIPTWWEAQRLALYQEIGDPVKDREKLPAISPLFNANRVKRPLMVLQGANDPRVIRVSRRSPWG